MPDYSEARDHDDYARACRRRRWLADRLAAGALPVDPGEAERQLMPWRDPLVVDPSGDVFGVTTLGEEIWVCRWRGPPSQAAT